jgi:hypothetical protein
VPLAIAAGSAAISGSKRARTEQISTANLDADDPLDDDDSDASDSDEDDTAQLLAELNRIKKERAQENSKKAWSIIVWSLETIINLLIFRRQRKEWRRKG